MNDLIQFISRSHRKLPDKAIDLINGAAARLRIEIDLKSQTLDQVNRKEVTRVLKRFVG